MSQLPYGHDNGRKMSRIQLIVTIFVLILCQEGWAMLDSNGNYFLCGTYPEMYGMRVTRKINGGYDMLHQVPRLPCANRTAQESRFRTFDGTCNAPEDQGAAFSVIKRLLPPEYHGPDGPRTYDRAGQALPPARLVSRSVHRPTSKPSALTLLVMQIGQLSDHDLSIVALPTELNDTIKCCGVPVAQRHKSCFPIEIPAGDHHFKTNCMEFTRSEAVHLRNGSMVLPRRHDNVITTFLDASFNYGSNRMTAAQLRTEGGAGALMLTRLYKGKERLPAGDPKNCINLKPDHFCPLCGDARCGEQPGLTAIHLVYVKEHNRLVRKMVRALLQEEKRSYGEIKDEAVESFIQTTDNSTKELLFQVARKVLGACWQNMLFSEFYPMLLGQRIMAKYDLYPGSRVAYDPSYNPSMTEEFNSAAYRFGHTLINNMMFTGEMRALKDLFGVSEHNLENYERIMYGLVGQMQAETYDSFLATSITDHLFENSPKNAQGFDLASLNLQRGRDHGIAPFNKLRLFFRLRPFTNFAQFGECAQPLRSVYQHPDDVDLFTGGTCEDSVPGGIVGEVFANIIGRQLKELKFGDRYYFETDSPFFGFTDAQLGSLEQLKLNKIICANSDLESIQWNPFHKPDPYHNPIIDCNRLPDVDMGPFLSYFKAH